MNIGIIVCDRVDPILSAEFGEFADMIIETLSPHGDFNYQLFDAMEGVLPMTDHGCDGFIITGSTFDAYADIDWINQLAQWIVTCDEAQTPLIGICFGHQIIARALGAQVAKSNKGWGIGMSVNQVTGQHDWMQPRKEMINILVSHQDQVLQLPDSLTTIASSDFCPNYMLIKQDHILTIQGHPEFSTDFEYKLLERKRELVGEEAYQNARTSLELLPDSALIMQWFAQFFYRAVA
ncbi:glutamine amidotransferase-related protein [Vibrio hippocampi]|uniref:Carbamoyl-phosphate synthase small chain n=1 Tax=Vibrio hippocampi TaxID=654686 RepID=A0ABM8ZMR9_9VIBR|nr:homoserine O-succinyltransferase [Vibrio hippocampi]CAH0529816.1 Carbamoyl-phosphate synthase small chain [Vibrio hippocampi]